MIPTGLRFFIPESGTNIEDGDQVVTDYITVYTSHGGDSGASVSAHRSKRVSGVSGQNGTVFIGAVVREYRPELMALLAEGL